MESGRIFQVFCLMAGSVFLPLVISTAGDDAVDAFDFLSQPQNITTLNGQSVRFVCQVRNLKSWQRLIWRHVNAPNVNTIVAIGNQISLDGDDRYVTEEEAGRKSTLGIRSAIADLEGSYVCEISGNDQTQVNTLTVNVPATIVAWDPEESTLEVDQGQQFQLNCTAQGKPSPVITWTKQGIEIAKGESINVDSAQKTNAGKYRCVAYNGAGDSTFKEFTVHVLFGPIVRVVTPVVRGHLGQTVTLECLFESFPLVDEITWSRDGQPINLGTQLLASRMILEDGHVASRLQIKSLKIEDVGVYRCRGTSVLADASDVVAVSGLPYDLLIASPQRSPYSNQYTLFWQVRSQSPLQETAIKVEWEDESDLKDEESNSTDFLSTKQRILTIPGKETGQPLPLYRQEVLLNDLSPSSTYTVTIRAKNVFGFSNWTQEFHMTTAEEGQEAPLATTAENSQFKMFLQDGASGGSDSHSKNHHHGNGYLDSSGHSFSTASIGHFASIVLIQFLPLLVLHR